MEKLHIAADRDGRIYWGESRTVVNRAHNNRKGLRGAARENVERMQEKAG